MSDTSNAPAKGSAADLVNRMAGVLPPWFGPPGTVPPVLRLPLSMAAEALAWLWSLIHYTRAQSRIDTATGGWLELIALDFFGGRIRRKAGQSDAGFRRRIKIEMFRPRNTRPAMISVLTDLTGFAPRIFEPSRPLDIGGVGVPSGLAIGASGAIGSMNLPGTVFIDVFRTPNAGISFAAGVGASVGGIGLPSRLVISDIAEVRGALTEQDIIAAVEATRPQGIQIWMKVLPAPSVAA